MDRIEDAGEAEELNGELLRLAGELSDDPQGNREILLRASDIYARMGNLRKAKSCFFSAIDFKPQDEGDLDPTLRSRMKSVMEAGDSDAAHKAWLSVMQIMSEQGYSESAEKLCLSALEKYPYCAHLHDIYGTISSYLVSIADGIEHIETAIKLDPLDSSSYLNLAELQVESGRYADAAQTLARASTLLENRPALFTLREERYLQETYARLSRMASDRSSEWTRAEVLQEALRTFHSLVHGGRRSGAVTGLFFHRLNGGGERLSPEVRGWPLCYCDDGGSTERYYIINDNQDIALLNRGRASLGELLGSPYSSHEIVLPDRYPRAADLLYQDMLSASPEPDVAKFKKFVEAVLLEGALKGNVVNVLGRLRNLPCGFGP
ncbi:MAG: tetratricopeptide repeat protein [Bifidobacteriaceae bacterium]|nr:tetratricopeptide repeat protein [Bifidobacteriaceae bacterium]